MKMVPVVVSLTLAMFVSQIGKMFIVKVNLIHDIFDVAVSS